MQSLALVSPHRIISSSRYYSCSAGWIAGNIAHTSYSGIRHVSARGFQNYHDKVTLTAIVVHAMPKYDPDKWIEQLLQCQHLPEQDMKILCDRVRAILIEESNIQPVSTPVTICGDIHGQFWDLLELLRKGGMVPQTSYIFMARMCCVRGSIVVCLCTLAAAG